MGWRQNKGGQWPHHLGCSLPGRQQGRAGLVTPGSATALWTARQARSDGAGPRSSQEANSAGRGQDRPSTRLGTYDIAQAQAEDEDPDHKCTFQVKEEALMWLPTAVRHLSLTQHYMAMGRWHFRAGLPFSDASEECKGLQSLWCTQGPHNGWLLVTYFPPLPHFFLISLYHV